MPRGFASDNNAGIHPNVLDAIIAANVDHVPAYGADPYTASAIGRFHEQFGDDVSVSFVFNGTAANVLGLSCGLRSYQGVICSEYAHIHEDECGAPERFLGSKLLPVPAPGGKLTVDAMSKWIRRIGDQHAVQPAAISLSQTTEYGTVYTIDELRAITVFARAHGLLVHMDGARIANAAVALGVPLRAITRDVGVDVLSFGGTKNGIMAGEAVVIFPPALAADMAFRRKQAMQLASKMRFIAAQFDALLSNDLWARNAAHANAMAARLAKGLRGIPGITITQPVQANVVFAILPTHHVPTLQAAYPFYVWDERTGEVRLMASFDTSEEDVHGFTELVATTLRA
jgi:threonine aldolase